MIKDYWANCNDEFERHDWAFTRLIVGQVEMYKVDIVIDGVEDNGRTYLTKLKKTPISLEPFEDVVEDLDMMLSKIYKRTRKWVMWTTKWKSRIKGMPIQSSPNIVPTSSSQSGALGTILPLTQGLAQPTRGGDQPLDKNITLDKTCQDHSVAMIGMEIEFE